MRVYSAVISAKTIIKFLIYKHLINVTWIVIITDISFRAIFNVL